MLSNFLGLDFALLIYKATYICYIHTLKSVGKCQMVLINGGKTDSRYRYTSAPNMSLYLYRQQIYLSVFRFKDKVF